MNSRFEELVSAYLDGDDDAVLSELRRVLEADPELRERFRQDVRLHTLVREIACESTRASVRPAGRRRPTVPRRRYWMAAAALVVLAAGALFVTTGRAPVPGTPTAGESALARLVRASERVKTVADLRTLHGLARSAHEEELNLGDGCNLERLVLLGLSQRMCEVPRDDRQAEGLRFIVRRAARFGTSSPAAAGHFDLLPAAEAAAPAMTIDMRREFRRCYMEGLGHLEKKDYYLYAGMVHAAQKMAPGSAAAEASRLAYAYVLLWERDISGAVFKYCEGWFPRSMYAEHYRDFLRPLVVERVERARALAANLGVDIAEVHGERRVADGWFLGAPEGAIVVEYAYTRRREAFHLLDTKPFLEAEFTGLIRMERETSGDVASEARVGVTFSPGRNTGKMIWLPREWTPHAHWVPESKEIHRWTRFRLHMSRLGDRSWKCELYVRLEGDFEEVNVQEETLIEAPSGGPVRVGLACNMARAKWTELGLRIIRPAEGK